MGLTEFPGGTAALRALMLVLLTFVCGREVYAQHNPGQLGVEIQHLELKLSLPDSSPAERHDALTRLARLRQLSGDIAAAAVNWLEAAAADPHDDSAVIAGAYCLAATGEWEKTAAVLRPLLAAGKPGPSLLQARYLDAFLQTWTSGSAAGLVSLASDPAFISLRSMIYYTLWQSLLRSPGIAGAGNAEAWKSRLLAEFPNSPEALAVNPPSKGNSASVSAVQSPLWLLLPGTAGSVPPEQPAVRSPSTAATSAHAPTATSVSPSQRPAGIVLQTGVFSKETNARAQAESLRKAGFAAVITSKLINATEHWAVTVPAGQDSKKTVADLKKAGFDSFPVKDL